MKNYLDITLLPDNEISLGFIWQKIYQQIHLALVENKTTENNSEIAISFPEYGNKKFPLGNKIRLFADSSEQLKQLDINKYLDRFTDYTHCTSIKEVPESVDQFVCFKRKQLKSNTERLARRRAKRKGETMVQALSYYAKFDEQESKLPFINVTSLSKSQRFRLFVEQVVLEEPVKGLFSCYGLSKNATVPWF